MLQRVSTNSDHRPTPIKSAASGVDGWLDGCNGWLDVGVVATRKRRRHNCLLPVFPGGNAQYLRFRGEGKDYICWVLQSFLLQSTDRARGGEPLLVSSLLPFNAIQAFFRRLRRALAGASIRGHHAVRLRVQTELKWRVVCVLQDPIARLVRRAKYCTSKRKKNRACQNVTPTLVMTTTLPV